MDPQFEELFEVFLSNTRNFFRIDLNFNPLMQLPAESRGLTLQQIDKISLSEWKNSFDLVESNSQRLVLKRNDIVCAVCLQCFMQGERVRKLNCGHCFHMECIDRWLKEKGVCPLDRGMIKS
jgi:hypothetical protein